MSVCWDSWSFGLCVIIYYKGGRLHQQCSHPIRTLVERCKNLLSICWLLGSEFSHSSFFLFILFSNDRLTDGRSRKTRKKENHIYKWIKGPLRVPQLYEMEKSIARQRGPSAWWNNYLCQALLLERAFFFQKGGAHNVKIRGCKSVLTGGGNFDT